MITEEEEHKNGFTEWRNEILKRYSIFFNHDKDLIRTETYNIKENKMTLQNYLYNRVLPIIQGWNEKGIYAISFWVHTNEDNVYNGISGFPEFSIGYNTTEDYNPLSIEEKWDFAFWDREMYDIISADEDDEGAHFLMNWYSENGIENIGYEDESTMYNENMEYIGKGPAGYYELLCAVSDVAKLLQSNGVINEKFGKIPVIVHDLEYSWYVIEATRNANPDGQADEFIEAVNSGFGYN